MSTHIDSLPLNITLSIGNVCFHLAPASAPIEDKWQASSPKELASPRTTAVAHRRRAQRRNQTQLVFAESDQPENSKAELPILSIRQGKSQQQQRQQPSSSSQFSSTSLSNANANNMAPPSPMRQHILGRVRAMKEKIEVEERRQSGSYHKKSNTIGSPEPRNSQPLADLSGYYVDLHSFTGTLRITSITNVNPVSNYEHSGGFDGGTCTSKSDYITKNSPGHDLQSPRKRIVHKNNGEIALKRSKTRSFTWIASNDNEVEIGMDRAVQNFMYDGIDSEKKFDFVDAVSDREDESKEEHPKFEFGSPTLSSKGVQTNMLDRSFASQKNKPTQDSGKMSKSLPTPQNIDNGPNHKASIQTTKQTDKARTSFSTPPKLLQYAQQAMKQIGFSAKEESYNVLGSDPALAVESSLRSWDAVTGGNEYNDMDGSELHHACASLDLSRIHRALESTDINGTMAIDSSGKLPIHVLADNRELITENGAACEDIVDIFAQIMGPDKMVQALHGSSGWGPFVGIIGRWVDELHDEAQQNGQLVSRSMHSPTGRQPTTGENQARTRTTFTQQLPLFRSADRNNERLLLSSLFMKDREKHFYVPYSVTINSHVKWAIRVLSNLIDSYPEQTREAILTNVTSTIPLFLKSVFLINDAKDLTQITGMSLVKHAAIDKRSINVWLIAMLTSTTREVQMRAVCYLKLLSRLTLTDLAATSQYRDKFSDAEIDRFVSLRKATFEALYSMPGIFPAVLGLGGRGIESLSTTRVMRYICYRTIRKDKQFFRLICDFFFGVLLLLGFRVQVEFVFTENHRDGPSGGYREHNYWTISTWALAFYFLVKDLLSLLSLYMTSTNLAKRYITSVFNMIDVAAVLILVVEGGPMSDDSISMSDGWAASLVTILLWLKLMGAFKILNQSFALFLYAVWEVIKEIKWFIVFLFMVAVMFSDAARAAVAVTGDCFSEEYRDTDFCSGGYFTVVRMYSILVGDVDLDYFGSSDLMMAVFFFFSLFCIIILLNILIAIIIDSYESTKERSREIFGRAQVEYAAALVARNQFIRPKENSEFHVASFVPHTSRRVLRLIYLISYASALGLFEYGFAGAIAYLRRIDSSHYAVTHNLITVYIIVGSIFNAYILTFAIIALLTWLEQQHPAIASKCISLKKCLQMAVMMFHRVMGFSSNVQQLNLSDDVIKQDEGSMN